MHGRSHNEFKNWKHQIAVIYQQFLYSNPNHWEAMLLTIYLRFVLPIFNINRNVDSIEKLEISNSNKFTWKKEQGQLCRITEHNNKILTFLMENIKYMCICMKSKTIFWSINVWQNRRISKHFKFFKKNCSRYTWFSLRQNDLQTDS